MTPVEIFWTKGSVAPDPSSSVRRWQVDYLQEHVSSRNPHVLIGPRQSGKSTLLKMLAEEDKSGGIPGAYLSLERFVDKPRNWFDNNFWDEFCTDVYEALGVEEPAEYSMHNSVFSHVPREARLYIDEFTHVAMTYPNFLSTMRGAFENRDRNSFPTILLADRTHPTQYSGSTYSPFNFTDSVYLLDFNEEETRNYIIAGCRKNGIDLTGEAAAKAWEQTQGQPYLVNKIGELLVLGARQDKKSEVTEKDVETACEFIMDEALAGSDAHFITLRRYLGDEKKEGDVYLDRPQKSELMNILHRGGSRFDLTNRELSVLFSLGFIGPTEVKMKYGKVVLAGDARIRNPLYKEFLENHL